MKKSVIRLAATAVMTAAFGFSSLAAGWTFTHGHDVYVSEEGRVLTGWISDNGETYYGKNTAGDVYGEKVTGWTWIDGKCYYFNSDGVLSRSTVVEGYTVDENGAWTEDGEAVVKEARGYRTELANSVQNAKA